MINVNYVQIVDMNELPQYMFLITFNIIDQYQRKFPSLIGNLKCGKYKRGYFFGGRNNNCTLITCKGKTFILLILQRYVVNLYHTYLLHTGLDRTQATIIQYLYWCSTRKSVQKEFINWLVPAHYAQFALILWYVAKMILILS